MITDYQSRKEEALNSYEKIEGLMKEIEDYAQQSQIPNPAERLDPLVRNIRNMAKKIREDRFSLVIAGESKSGKSTFINAYLGSELLPMDVKQCTSAIIKVKHGEKFCIEATYADGRPHETIEGSAAKKFLKENGALDDNYRDIPVPIINSEILIKSGLRAKKKNKQIVIKKNEVEDLLNAPEVQAANIHNLPSRKYNEKIRHYIEVKKNSWKDIVTNIEVFFPLGKGMHGIEIIDTPGVCARGGAAEITSKYIKNADAIIFLKSISGQALESTQFEQFMHQTTLERNKNALFLALTRTTDVPSNDLHRLKNEAYQQFKNLNKENILFIDSKAELYAKKFSKITDVESELRRLNKLGTLDDFTLTAYQETNGFLGEGDFIQALQQKSNFNAVYNALETFGRKAHYILLSLLLDSICTIYSKLDNDLACNLDSFRKKAEDPRELAKKITRVNEEIKKIENKLYDKLDEVTKQFIGDEGIISQSATKEIASFSEEVSQINPRSDRAFTELEEISKKKIQYYIDLTTTLSKKIVSQFDKELITLSKGTTVPSITLQPNFTEETFKDIKESNASKAYIERSYEDGATFKKTHTYSEYSQNKHFNLIKNSITERLDTIQSDLVGLLLDFTFAIRKRYRNDLEKNALIKMDELDSIEKKKATAEQLLVIIEQFNIFMKKTSLAQSDAEKIKGGIEKNVQ
ncbi:GTPase domain-containing protein [Desulfobaculum bizertense]|uniref:Dynamin family protein n=1 Tax=Desulfobaculum bizertense DSM 18034 TaxID=1121442 RepID=A0A1T4VSH5_9BACT|nr:GTPase domain-containing protein [Desulfobaculum bizertense]SKA67954.1 Dynamin family protein [Desulfobaculum bizertense DSM 18034]